MDSRHALERRIPITDIGSVTANLSVTALALHVPSSYDLYVHGIDRGGAGKANEATQIAVILDLLRELRPTLPVMRAEVNDLTSCVVVRTAPGVRMRERRQGLGGKAIAAGR